MLFFFSGLAFQHILFAEMLDITSECPT